MFGIPDWVKYLVVLSYNRECICKACVKYFEFDNDETSQDSWENYVKCMCKVSKQIFIGVRDIHQDRLRFRQNEKFGQHLPGTFDFSKTKIQIFYQFEETKMANSLPF